MAEELEFDVAMASMVHLMREGGLVRYADAMRVFRKHFLRYSLQVHGRNVTCAAAELGMHRNSIGRLLQEAGSRLVRDRRGD